MGWQRILAYAVAPLVVGGTACNGGDTSTALGGIQQIAYIARTPNETGNVFEYTRGGAPTDQSDIFLLSPPSASGTTTNLTKLPAGSDINAMDLSFDAREIVYSARLAPMDHYHLFRINLDGTNPCEPGKTGACQITDGPNDEVYPIYLPGDRIFFTTNQNVEGAKVAQFRDEYERATTAQVATIAKGGGDLQLGARNVSHRVFPTLLSDGRVAISQWDHLGDKNEANIVLLNQDMTGNREGFGKEGKGVTNSYVRAREIAPGKLVAIGTSRDRTFQAGKILQINLGPMSGDPATGTVDMSKLSEANSSAVDLTPDVPGDREPSFAGVGRYYDAVPVNDPAQQRFLVSWADGPVESSTLGMASSMPMFGIYLYDAKAKTRFPIVVLKDKWAISPIPVQKRAEPPMQAAAQAMMAQGTTSTLLAAINVYDSSLFQIVPGSVSKVRVMEGFSTEEGIPEDFGLTEFDGHALLGEFDPNPDGSFKALVPANTPIHIQLVDQYGMAVGDKNKETVSEPIWIQGRAGEARVCGGCHENRTQTPTIQPGSSVLQAAGAVAMDLPRDQRKSMDFSPAKVKGVPWTLALQPIFDAHCVDCHDGTKSAANPSYTIIDVTDNNLMFSFTFNLKSDPIKLDVAGRMYNYSASHVSLMGPSMLFREKQIMFTMDSTMPKTYVEPGSAKDSTVIQMLNPPLRYPSVDMTKRAFMGMAHPAEVTQMVNGHSGSDPKYQLSADEYYLMILMADMGGQYYSRENAPGGGY